MVTDLLCLSEIGAQWLVACLYIVVGLLLGAAIYLAVKRRKGVKSEKVSAKEFTFRSVTYLSKIALFSAMGVVLLYIEFPILPAVSHLKLNVSDVPSLLAAFMFGPISGVTVNAVKVGVCLLIRGTSTGFVGDLSNLISGTVYAAVAGFIYLIARNKKGAIAALAVSSGIFCAVMWVCNQYMLIPLFGLPEEMVTPTLWWTLLFNVIKTTLTCVLTFFVYKPLSRALHWQIQPSKKTTKQSESDEAKAATQEPTQAESDERA